MISYDRGEKWGKKFENQHKFTTIIIRIDTDKNRRRILLVTRVNSTWDKLPENLRNEQIELNCGILKVLNSWTWTAYGALLEFSWHRLT